MIISRLIAGLVCLAIGITLVIFSFFNLWWLVFYGIPLILIGLFILLNKNEDKIENRKDLKERKYKK